MKTRKVNKIIPGYIVKDGERHYVGMEVVEVKILSFWDLIKERCWDRIKERCDDRFIKAAIFMVLCSPVVAAGAYSLFMLLGAEAGVVVLSTISVILCFLSILFVI